MVSGETARVYVRPWSPRASLQADQRRSCKNVQTRTDCTVTEADLDQLFSNCALCVTLTNPGAKDVLFGHWFRHMLICPPGFAVASALAAQPEQS